MTNKELKKLSRLELLELLLAETRENEKLREELGKIKQENTIEKSAQHLIKTSEQLETAIRNVRAIANVLNKNVKREAVAVNGTEERAVPEKEETTFDKSVDIEIYKSLIIFFFRNPDALSVLPDDVRNNILNRIDEYKNEVNEIRQKSKNINL